MEIMPRPISTKEMKKDVPFKVLETNSKEDALQDVDGISDTVPITRHYNFQTTIEKRYYYDG
jgi:hypothetical protein